MEEKRLRKVAAERHSKPTHTKIKRRLNFPAETGAPQQTFYLDIVGNSDLTSRYTAKLNRRGREVAQFFDKNVHVLVTNRPPKGSSPTTNPSPATSLSKPSPFSNSPLTPVESMLSSRAAPATMSRGQRALSLAKKRSGSAKAAQVDLATKAAEWGIQVWSLKQMEDWLAATKCLDSRSPAASKTPRVRTLKAPFLKVEDQTGNYRPLLLEMPKLPLPDVSTCGELSPYDTPRPHHRSCRANRPPATHRKSKTHHARTRSAVAGVAAAAGGGGSGGGTKAAAGRVPGVAAAVEKKSGYCECCKTHFQSLAMHVTGTAHTNYACNDKNYASLDQAIAQGTTFHQFLATYTTPSTSAASSSTSDSGSDGGSNSVGKGKKSSKTPVRTAANERTPGFDTPMVFVSPPTPHDCSLVKNGRKRSPTADHHHEGGNGGYGNSDEEPLFLSPKQPKVALSPCSPSRSSGGVTTRGRANSLRSTTTALDNSGSPRLRSPRLSPQKPLQKSSLKSPRATRSETSRRSPRMPPPSPARRSILKKSSSSPIQSPTPTPLAAATSSGRVDNSEELGMVTRSRSQGSSPGERREHPLPSPSSLQQQQQQQQQQQLQLQEEEEERMDDMPVSNTEAVLTLSVSMEVDQVSPAACTPTPRCQTVSRSPSSPMLRGRKRRRSEQDSSPSFSAATASVSPFSQASGRGGVAAVVTATVPSPSPPLLPPATHSSPRVATKSPLGSACLPRFVIAQQQQQQQSVLIPSSPRGSHYSLIPVINNMDVSFKAPTTPTTTCINISSSNNSNPTGNSSPSPFTTTTSVAVAFVESGEKDFSRRSVRILAKTLSHQASPDKQWKTNQSKAVQHLDLHPHPPSPPNSSTPTAKRRRRA